MRLLAIIGLMATSACSTIPEPDKSFEDDFFVENYGGVFGLHNDSSEECINAVAKEEIAKRLRSIVGDGNDAIQDDERILLRIKIVPLDAKIHAATQVHRMGEWVTSSGPWITFEGKQRFLVCDQEKVFEIIDYRGAD